MLGSKFKLYETFHPARVKRDLSLQPGVTSHRKTTHPSTWQSDGHDMKEGYHAAVLIPRATQGPGENPRRWVKKIDTIGSTPKGGKSGEPDLNGLALA